MFHIFDSNQGDAESRKEGKRRAVVIACDLCRRRKARCDGQRPCETCKWYRKSEHCHYSEPRARRTSSRRSIDTLDRYQAVLHQLFPNVELDSLANLSRGQLLDLLDNGPQQQQQGQQQQLPVRFSSFSGDSSTSPADVDAESLEILQTMPLDAPSPSDASSSDISNVADDVNALSFSVKEASTYLGISSVMAVWRVICYLAPDAESHFSQNKRCISSSIEGRWSAERINCHVIGPEQAFSENHCQHLIDCYFSSFHRFAPLVGEQSFRETYAAKSRTDGRWLGLLNIVLAMGSIAASKSDDHTHKRYFNRAKQFFNLDSLGSANLETVQALALMAGFYLHYVQQPNLAITLMSAALRLATALGLHREYIHGRKDANAMEYSFELRRRVWWSIVVLDSWASLVLGRPSMGRWNDAITARLPEHLNVRIEERETILVLRQNIRFCQITTQIEDALALCPAMEESNLAALDASLVDWYLQLPLSVRLHTSVASDVQSTEDPRLTTVKSVVRWRYLTARIILHRPALLWYTMRRIPFEKCSDDMRAAIVTCREVAKEAVYDIASTWKGHKPSQVTGWNATWLLYQASMVPLLTLLSEGHDDAISDSCHRQIKQSMAALEDMRYYSPTAVRSLEVVSTIYEICKSRSDRSAVGNSQPPYLESLMPISNFSPTMIGDAFDLDGTLGMPSDKAKEQSKLSPGVIMDDIIDSMLWGSSESMLFADGPNSFGEWGFPEQSDQSWFQFGDSCSREDWRLDT
ncbi:fungal-specific transcription factor domain-containing protein [Lipomyces doorenjongii]|uniref:fungal-specific transcription factor domain-containing protein n=1 Tax=Lipomyces doorenjongii TaxID=383834 RepID=UPI0034CD861F